VLGKGEYEFHLAHEQDKSTEILSCTPTTERNFPCFLALSAPARDCSHEHRGASTLSFGRGSAVAIRGMPLRFARSLVWLLIGLGVVIGFLRLTMLRWWQIPPEDAELGVSIAPTLWAGDWVILWRLSPPGFGDLVVCPDPNHPTQPLIGRIAAEGGDKLVIADTGDLKVNTLRVTTEQACRQRTFVVTDPNSGSEVTLHCEFELLGGVSHPRGRLGGSAQRPLAQEVEVPSGHVYLVSDNRQFPFDSRHFGALDRKSCQERVLFRLVSREGFFDVDRRLTLIH
jgi:signal peptidase I